MDFNYFLSVLGLVLFIEGLPYFLFPEKFKKFLSQMALLPDLHLRAFGFIAMVFGLVLLYFVRSRLSF